MVNHSPTVHAAPPVFFAGLARRLTGHLLCQRVGIEMALHVLAYNLKRVMNIMGIGPLIAAMSAA